jgi:hypothetical protein
VVVVDPGSLGGTRTRLQILPLPSDEPNLGVVPSCLRQVKQAAGGGAPADILVGGWWRADEKLLRVRFGDHLLRVISYD